MNSDEMISLIGKQVIVTIAREPELTEFTGRLLAVSVYGDASIALPDGRTSYLWPALEIREAD